MKCSRITRIGIESGQMGYLGPIFKKDGNLFEYIPIPTDRSTKEQRTYGRIRCVNNDLGYGNCLADFMHVDRHKYPVRREEPRYRGRAKASDIKPHFDPEWSGNCTFGTNKWSKNLPKSFNSSEARKKDRSLFFLAGLMPFDPDIYHESKRTWNGLHNYQAEIGSALFLVGFFRIKEIHDFGETTTKENLDRLRRKFSANAHIKEGYRKRPIIFEGYKDDSLLLRHASSLIERRNGKYVQTRLGKRLQIPPKAPVQVLDLFHEYDGTTTEFVLKEIRKQNPELW
jgi:hypothetical protein